jgi:tetratricopeptide (TPR) repeat protein
MTVEIAIFLLAGAGVLWLLTYMLLQKGESTVQGLIREYRYVDAIAEADRILGRKPEDNGTRLHRAEAAKLAGAFEEALGSYREILRRDSRDAAAREGEALTLAHLGRSLPEAIAMMETTLQVHPAILEFQALSLAFIELTAGRRDDALRLYSDNSVLLQTRFEMDYTDPDPLLAETLFLYATLAEAAGEREKAMALYAKVARYAPSSVFARWATAKV